MALCQEGLSNPMPQHTWCRHPSAIGSTLQLGDLKISKKISDTEGAFHAKMGTIKERNDMDLTEAEDIKKRWQEYQLSRQYGTGTKTEILINGTK